MILYRPLDGDAHTTKLNYRPRTAFVMTQLGKPIHAEIELIRSDLTRGLKKKNIQEIDATSEITGRDFLMKIWGMVVSVPLGIAIINKEMTPQTLANIFFEIGLMQAYGKETLVIKTENSKVPSDFIRTEYIEYNEDFKSNLDKFISSFIGLPDYFETIADQLENNPLLAIDYLRRAYLISADEVYRQKAQSIFADSSIEGRAKNSVEMLLVDF